MYIERMPAALDVLEVIAEPAHRRNDPALSRDILGENGAQNADQMAEPGETEHAPHAQPVANWREEEHGGRHAEKRRAHDIADDFLR